MSNKESKLTEILKNIFKFLFGGGSHGGPGGNGGPSGPSIDGFKQSLENVTNETTKLSDKALQDGDFLKAYMLESQIQALKEMSFVLDNPDSGITDMNELAIRTDSIMKGKMAELSKDERYKELMSDYKTFDPKTIEAKEKEVMSELSSIMKGHDFGDKGNSVGSLLRESARVSMGILRDNGPVYKSKAQAEPFHSDLEVVGKLGSLQVGLINKRELLIGKGDLIGAVAIEFQRQSLMKLEDPSKFIDADNPLNSIGNLTERDMLKEAIDTVSFHSSKNAVDRGMAFNNTFADLTNGFSKPEVLLGSQKNARAMLSEEIKTHNFGGLETKVLEQVDQSIGQVVSSTVIDSKTVENGPEKDNEDNGLAFS